MSKSVQEMSDRSASEHQFLIDKDAPRVEESSKMTITPPERRAEVDMIMILLTYGIYLWHLAGLYTPKYYIWDPNLVANLSEDPFTIISPEYILDILNGFMDVWNMPMFFYLSGRNAYGSLFRRSETRFRDERVHRLLVPALFLFVVTQSPLALTYFDSRHPYPKESFLDHLRGFYRIFYPQQAWFLLYLFIYSQIFTHWFRAFHPVHNTSESTALSCCSSTACCCTVKPFNRLTKFFCCLNFIFKPAETPDQFVSAVKWFLGGPIKLALIPALLVGLVQTTNNLIIPYYYEILPHRIAQLGRTKPFFTFMVVFILGYTTAAAEKEIRQDSKLWSWTCFVTGTVLGIVQFPIQRHLSGIYWQITSGLMYGFGMWLFLIGSLALARKYFSEPKDWHQTFRIMAMPFYLIHLQIISVIATGAMWVPYLRTFPVMLIITTFLSIALSYLITKSGPFCYFFGLPPPNGSCLPGKQLRGFVPVLVLSGLAVIQMLLANLL